MLHIYNTLTRRKEQFRPLVPGRVGMYVCGMTVYDYCHLGHARMLLVFDVVARYLRHRGHRLTYVRNITDIDDKIIARAEERGESIDAVTARFIAAMHEDCEELRILPPDREPRATEHVEGMLALISDLMDKGYAYRAEGGDVCFEIARFRRVRKLSGNRVEALRAGARVGVDETKAAAVDFVLWKAAKPGEPWWPSPWVRAGRAGTSSAPRCRWKASASSSTSTAGVPTSSFPITSARSPSRRRAPENGSRTCGYTTRSSGSTATRCQSRSATSSPSGTSSPGTPARRCVTTC